MVSGPIYKALKIEGNKIRIFFDHVGSGLMVGRKSGREPTVEVKNTTPGRFAMGAEHAATGMRVLGSRKPSFVN